MRYKQSFVHQIIHFFKHQHKEYRLMWVLGMMFFIILMRLFWLQVITSFTYEDQLIKQHFTTQNIKAQRGDIYVTDDSGQPIQLTESVDLYTVSIDPKFVKYKEKVIEILTPFIYQHLCELHGTSIPTKLQCIQSLESFTQTDILPPTKHQFFVISKGTGTTLNPTNEEVSGQVINTLTVNTISEESMIGTGISSFDEAEYNDYLVKREDVITKFTKEQ
jgi:cell division protein FtsI/penicillin-binding protein 2